MGIRVSIALLKITLLLPLSAYAQAPEGTSNNAEDTEPEVEYSFSQSRTVTIGVMELKGVGLSQRETSIIVDLIAEQISKLGDVRVVTEVDIRSMLNVEKQRRIAGCSDKECFAEIAGTLGMSWMVTGSVGILGESIMLNLKLIDVRNAYVAGRATRMLKGNVDGLLDELPEATQELFDRVASRIGFHLPGRVAVAARHFQPIEQSPSAVTVITREDIEASGATTVADLLRLVPGMDVVIASRFFTSISARLFWTFENNLYLVLVDGQEANVELVGQAPWAIQPISMQDIERIEVIRGPGSSLYGANAVAGVVSITTRSMPEKTTGHVHLLGGQYGTMIAAAQASTRMGGFGLSVSGGANLARKFVDPAKLAKEVLKFRAVGEYRWSETDRLLLDLGLSGGSGPFSTAIGTLDTDNILRTLRLAYDSDNLRGQLSWAQNIVGIAIDTPLEYGGVRLANLAPSTISGNTFDAQVQWTLPTFWKPLLVIAGGGGRASYLSSDDMLDGESYADSSSPDYHELGISHWEFRASAFVHGELAPADWVTATLGARLDYNTVTKVFLSPRLAAVFKPASGQFIRLGVARAFRKPAFLETHAHLQAHCPPESPLAGPACDNFKEFMSRVVGNDQLNNEELTAFELGYLGQYFDNRLSVAVDLYFNLYSGVISFVSDITTDERGLPDLDASRVTYQHVGNWDIFGSEITVRYNPSERVSLMFSWSHREMFEHESGGWIEKVPKNMFTLGGRFRTEGGLVGSMYLFTRSEFLDTAVENPAGLLEPVLPYKFENVLLVLGKIGWRWSSPLGFNLEAGCQIFLPVSPFSSPHFRYFERAGGFTANGTHFGGDQLRQMVTTYLQGSF